MTKKSLQDVFFKLVEARGWDRNVVSSAPSENDIGQHPTFALHALSGDSGAAAPAAFLPDVRVRLEHAGCLATWDASRPTSEHDPRIEDAGRADTCKHTFARDTDEKRRRNRPATVGCKKRTGRK